MLENHFTPLFKAIFAFSGSRINQSRVINAPTGFIPHLEIKSLKEKPSTTRLICSFLSHQEQNAFATTGEKDSI